MHKDRTATSGVAQALTSDPQIRARAEEALRLGRFEIPNEALEGANVDVIALIENLRIYQAELELQNQELQNTQLRNQVALERFSSFFNSVPIAELVLDQRALILEANLAAQTLFRLRPNHLRRQHFARLIADRDRAAFIQAWSDLPQHPHLELPEIQLRIATEEVLIGDLHIAPLPASDSDSDSDEQQYVCAVVDRSEAVQQRRALDDAQCDLQKRMAELSCLYDVAQLTGHDDLSLQAVFERVAERLPAATRYPDRCQVCIQCGDQQLGPDLIGSQIAAEFSGCQGQIGRVAIAYEPPLPDSLGAAFLAEEQDMLQGIASRLSAIATRREALTELHDNHTLIEAIFRRAPDAIELVDPETLQILDANDASCQFLGFQRDELLQHSVDIFQADLYPAALRRLTKQIVASGGARFETRLRRKDGTIFDTRVHVRALHLHSRTYLLSIWRDVSAEKASQAQIRKLSTVVEQSPNSVVITDLETRIEYVNDAFVQKTGYSRSKVIGQTPQILKSGRTPPATYEQMWQTLRRGEPWKGEFINLTQAGAEQIEAATIIPLRQADNEVTHYVAIKEDITERKRLSEELERHREHLEQEVEARTAELAATTASLIEANNEQQALFDAATAGIVFVRDRKIVRLNRTLAELFGYTPDEMIGQSTRVWYADEGSFVAIGERILETFQQGGVHREERELRRKDGSRFWARMTAQAIDRADASKGVAGMIIDITAERKAVAQLAKAKAMAEAAARTKSDFLARMSHEIRTPMNAVIGFSHLALNTDLDPKQRDYLSKISQSAQLLLRILNDILDFSKIEAGRLEMESIPFRLDEVLEQVLSVITHEAKQKPIELLIDRPSDVPGALIGDPLRLGQILINLLNNAVKFTDQGEVGLSIRLLERRDAQVQLEIRVRDTGIGISQAAQAKLFRAFGQADDSTTRKYGGSGLGLSICKHLVEMMGGSIEVESAPGQGSCFRFEVWLAIDPKARPSQGAPAALRGTRVLVVDDNASARTLLCRTLEELGCIATTVADAEAAFAELLQAEQQAMPFRVLLMDWQMPQINGIEATRRIKQGLALAQCPAVLVLAACCSESNAAEAKAAGADTVLSKPISRWGLREALLTVLGEQAREYPASLGHVDADAEDAPVMLAGARVLLVEDNEINQQIAVELLESVGVSVDVVANGREAVDLLLGASPPQFDGVLMDVQMPLMGGYEATRRIRADPRHQHLPIIGLTAHAIREERERCLESGMCDHVTKPIEPRVLYRAMERHFQTRNGRGDSTRRLGNRQSDDPSPTSSRAPRQTRSTRPTDRLDVADGVSRLMGNHQLYRKLLKAFVDRERDSAERIAEDLQAGDREQARLRAHSLKGLAGNIGAHRLARSAAALETAIREQAASNLLDGQMTGLREELDQLSAAILDQLQQHSSLRAEDDDGAAQQRSAAGRDGPLADAQDVERTCALLDALMAALDRSEIDEQALAGLRQTLAPEVFASLEQRLDGFEFEQACELAKALRTGAAST
ncbi:PAS domain S-box protein [Lamprobacter modestohalophilus]|nr:PAS domain S-box protein [Lamprobacter modestohalophilus]